MSFLWFGTFSMWYLEYTDYKLMAIFRFYYSLLDLLSELYLLNTLPFEMLYFHSCLELESVTSFTTFKVYLSSIFNKKFEKFVIVIEYA